MIRIDLDETEREHLRRQSRQEIGRVAERLHFVLLSDQGYSSPEIARLFGYHPATVRTWLEGIKRKGWLA